MKKFILLWLIWFVSAGILLPESIGKVIRVTGRKELYSQRGKDEKQFRISEGAAVSFGDFIVTGKETTARLQLNIKQGNAEIEVKENSKVRLVEKIKKTEASGVFLVFGRLWNLFKSKNHTGYAVETYNSVAGVEGTEFEVAYDPDTKITELQVISGKVQFTAKSGFSKVGTPLPEKKLLVEAGKTAEVTSFGKVSVKDLKKTGTKLPEKNKLKGFDPPPPDADMDAAGTHTLYLALYAKNAEVPMTHPVKIWINGCSTIGGEPFRTSGNGIYVIPGLEPDCEYTVTIRTSGCNFTDQITTGNLDDSRVTINFWRIYFRVRLQDLQGVKGDEYDMLKNPNGFRFFIRDHEVMLNRDFVPVNPDMMQFTGPYELEFYYPEKEQPLNFSIEIKGFKEKAPNFLDKYATSQYTIDIVPTRP